MNPETFDHDAPDSNLSARNNVESPSQNNDSLERRLRHDANAWANRYRKPTESIPVNNRLHDPVSPESSSSIDFLETDGHSLAWIWLTVAASLLIVAGLVWATVSKESRSPIRSADKAVDMRPLVASGAAIQKIWSQISTGLQQKFTGDRVAIGWNRVATLGQVIALQSATSLQAPGRQYGRTVSQMHEQLQAFRPRDWIQALQRNEEPNLSEDQQDEGTL